MPQIRIQQAAQLLGCSDDTMRRWIEAGKVTAGHDEAGRQAVDGASLAALAQEQAASKGFDELDDRASHRSARNHLTGLVVKVHSDPVMSQVELQCGRYRIVSLISTEAVEQLGLAPGKIATAVIKSTSVAIEA